MLVSVERAIEMVKRFGKLDSPLCFVLLGVAFLYVYGMHDGGAGFLSEN
jgi:hypothetical protein